MLACEAGTVKSSAPIPGEPPGRLGYGTSSGPTVVPELSWGGPKNFGIYNAPLSAHPVVLNTGVRKLPIW